MGYELRRQLREALGPDITGLQRAVALEIADDANERTRRSWAALEDLARWTGAKDGSVVRNALKRLAAAGWEFRVPIGKGKDGRALYAVPGTRMTFLVPHFEGGATATPSSGKGEPGLPLGGATATPSPPQGGATAHSEGAVAPSEGAVAPPFSSYSSDSKKLASWQPAADLDYGIPADARPLINSLAAAGVNVRWPFRGNDWFPLLALIKKSGVPAMVDHALKVAARTPVDSARYFMPGWSELAPIPPADTPRPALHAVPASRSTADQRVAQGQALAAMFREQEQHALEAGHTNQEPA
ncbi:hypothetical protein [Streptomyces azureus]|uniref:Uncharacterized protein n=1 Tax=Streptomyces azureus TaxID=146537 RepID=A0A0K8PGB4_STRAJ|nr:hypothetical protein [Streptomyces azureus]GAP46922.1 uncharacterized protein SAZU_1659 [Streptomyces azureus]